MLVFFDGLLLVEDLVELYVDSFQGICHYVLVDNEHAVMRITRQLLSEPIEIHLFNLLRRTTRKNLVENISKLILLEIQELPQQDNNFRIQISRIRPVHDSIHQPFHREFTDLSYFLIQNLPLEFPMKY